MKKIRKILLLSLVAGTLISYLSVLISPADFKLSAGLSILIPVFIGLNLVVFIVFLLRRSSKLLVPLVLLVLGYPFLKVTIAYNSTQDKTGDFTLIGYNVQGLSRADVKGGNLIHDFIEKESPDVICFQEFRVSNQHIKPIIKAGNYQTMINPQRGRLAMFTRFPVHQHGVLFEGELSNNIMYADLIVNEDTVRVYNLHLESMGINTSKLQDTEGIRSEYDKVKTKFLEGAAARAMQIDVLMKHLQNSPYPVIMAGDFNDVPFSYNHFRIRRELNNAFESAGKGFGITYNGRLPFLRIDHQFYSEGLQVRSFKTFEEIGHSDHFPILGIYALSD